MSAPVKAIVIGASAGAVDALMNLLPTLPADYPLPVIIVVHLPPDKRSVLAELFQAKCDMRIVEAEDKEPLVAGTAYFAPPNYHVLVEKNGMLSLSNEEPHLFSRPSIDLLFESAADAFGAGALGILLTGANEDGALGLKMIEDAGGRVIAQHPNEAPYSVMPLAGLTKCTNAQALKLNAIAETLRKVAYEHAE